jgi:hypothetical protein
MTGSYRPAETIHPALPSTPTPPHPCRLSCREDALGKAVHKAIMMKLNYLQTLITRR